MSWKCKIIGHKKEDNILAEGKQNMVLTDTMTPYTEDRYYHKVNCTRCSYTKYYETDGKHITEKTSATVKYKLKKAGVNLE